MNRLGRFMLLFLLASCGADPSPSDSAISQVDPISLLGAPGPWARVGRTHRAHTWTEPGVATDRELELTIWYPSAAGDQLTITEEATLSDGAYPLAIWSHGHQAYAEAASHLCSHLASHGWVVVAPTHDGNTITDGPDRTTEIYYLRPWDLRKSLDAILDDAELAPIIDDTVGVLGMGHSFGGYTILSVAGAMHDIDVLEPACANGTGPSSFCATMTPDKADIFRAGFRDPRVIAAIAMAPGDFDIYGHDGIAEVSVPTMLMSAQYDYGGPKDAFWSALPGPEDRHVYIERAGHNAFTDFPPLVAGTDDLMDDIEVWRIIDVYVGAFAAVHTGDESPRPIIDGALIVSEDAAFFLE